MKKNNSQKQSQRIPTTNETPEKTENRSTQKECNECGNKVVKKETGEMVCNECGLVVSEDYIDRGPDWRNFSGENENKRHVGSPLTVQRHDRGLTTTIGNDSVDQKGNTIPNKKKSQIRELRKWNKRISAEGREQSLRSGLGEIDRIGSALGLPGTIKETASMIYRQAHKRDLLVGRSIEAIAAGSIYIATRKCGSPRTPEEIYPLTQMQSSLNKREQKKEFNRTQQYLINELNISVSPTDPQEHINRFVSRLDFEKKTELVNKTKKFLSNLDGTDLPGTAPSSITAAGIYAASLTFSKEEKITQEEVGEAAGVSVVTIRTYYRDIINANKK